MAHLFMASAGKEPLPDASPAPSSGYSLDMLQQAAASPPSLSAPTIPEWRAEDSTVKGPRLPEGLEESDLDRLSEYQREKVLTAIIEGSK